MDMLFKISPENFGNGHLFIFIFSVLAVVAFLLVYGIRKKIPFSPWILILFYTFLFAIIGGKLFSYSFSDWQSILSTWQFPATGGKRLFGYFLLGLLGFILIKRWLKFKIPVGDAFAFAWPIGLIVTRIGCLIGGCCFGTITTLPFGISYGTGSQALHLHQHEGLIAQDAIQSLLVHPIPLYEIAFCLVLLSGLYIAYKRKWGKTDGNLFYISLLVYGVFRFFEEFIRSGNEFALGLKSTQLLVLGLSTLMVIVIYFRNKRGIQTDVSYNHGDYIHRIVPAYFVLFVLFFAVSDWLSASEIIVLRLFGLIGLLGILHLLYEQYTFKQLKTVPFFLGLLAFVLMSQTLSEPIDSTFFQRKYFKVSGGIGFGSEEEICGGVNEYYAGGLSIEHTKQYSEYKKFTMGAQLYALNYADEGFYPGLNPYLRFEGKYAAGGIGLNYVNVSSTYREELITPTLYLRLGRPDVFFADGSYGTYMPGGLPTFQMGLGVGFKNHPNNNIRFGISSSGLYLNSHFLLDSKVALDPYISIANEDTWHFGVAMHYHIFHE